MNIKFLNKSFLIILFFYQPFQTKAWGVLGHRIVGQIAQSYLTPKAKAEVLKILGTETIALSSNYADFIKSDSTYNYLSPWHYVNLKGGLNKSEVQLILKNDTAVDAYTKINFIVKQLKNIRLLKEWKSFYLKLLIHIVGDIHQPMHVGRLEDEGGNRIKLQWFNTPTNLHTVWDSRLIDFQQLSYTEYATAINFTTKEQRTTWQKQPLGDWIFDSYQYAEKIYSNIQPDDKLSYSYNFQYIQILNNQLLKGGVHLAGLLNEIFKR